MCHSGPASVNTGDRKSPGWVRGLYLRLKRGRYVLERPAGDEQEGETKALGC